MYKESFKTRIERIGFNFFPAYRGTGAWVKCISSDYRYVEIQIPLSFKTRNYVGTIFGGSMFAAVDPVYMVMFYKVLGKGYVIWVKESTIKFIKPGVAKLVAKFELSNELTTNISDEISRNTVTERNMKIDLIDVNNVKCAEVMQTLFFRVKNEKYQLL